MKLSIIVPCYNERGTVLEVLSAIATHPVDGVTYEVVVVDDGSTDGSGALLEKNSQLYTTLIRQQPNQGKGAAVIAGLKAATGDYVLFQDADLEYSPSDYPKLLYPARRFDSDIVVGSRILAPQYIRVHYFWNILGNRLLTLFFNLLFNMTFTDIYSCYLMYRRSLVDPEKLRAHGWDQHAEILCEAVRNGRVAYEVPISYHGRSYAEGKKIRGWHAAPVFWMIFRKRIGTLFS